MRILLPLFATAVFMQAQNKPAAPAPAPAAPPAQILQQAVRVDVKPDSVREFEETVRTALAPAMKKGGKPLEVWQTTRVGPMFRYIFVVNGMSYGDLDQQPAWMKALGAEGAGALEAKLAKMVNRMEVSLVRIREDLTNWKSGGALKLVAVFMADVNPAKRQEMEALWKAEVLPAHKKANSLLVTQEDVLGGNLFSLQWVVPIDNFAQLQSGMPLQRALGPEGFARFQAKAAPMFFSLRREVWRLRGDLGSVTP